MRELAEKFGFKVESVAGFNRVLHGGKVVVEYRQNINRGDWYEIRGHGECLRVGSGDLADTISLYARDVAPTYHDAIDSLYLFCTIHGRMVHRELLNCLKDIGHIFGDMRVNDWPYFPTIAYLEHENKLVWELATYLLREKLLVDSETGGIAPLNDDTHRAVRRWIEIELDYYHTDPEYRDFFKFEDEI